MDYICINCNKRFASNQCLIYHSNKKNKCDNTNHNNNITHNNIKCEYCNKQFLRKYNLDRHIKNNCNIIKQNRKITDRINILETETKTLLELINCKNNEIIKIDNINMIDHGKEDFNMIDHEDILESLRHGCMCVLQFIHQVYFNIDYNELKNIYLPNISSNNIMIYNDGKWIYADMKDTIDSLYTKCSDYLISIYESYIGQLTDTQKKSLLRWIDPELKISDKDKLSHEANIKKEIKLLLYNKKNIILANRKKYNV
jgi:hypothetical protein